MTIGSRRAGLRLHGQARPLRRLNLVLAGLVVFGVLAQAGLAGRHIGAGAPITLHGVLGNVVFGFQAAVVVLAARRPRHASSVLLAMVLLVLLVSQIGLGYAGRSSATPVAWHVSNGVALFGLAVALTRFAGQPGYAAWAAFGACRLASYSAGVR